MKQLAVLVVIVGCTPEVPASPSFQEDVMPILAANCVRCHGAPPIGGAPGAFRLDSLDDVAIVDDPGPDPVCGETVICGAARLASLAAARVSDDRAPMPPRFPLDDYQIATLERWAESPVRGTPRATNRAPAIAVDAVSRTGTIATVRVRIDDPDGDLVAGTLRARVDDRDRLVGAVHAGANELAWDVTGIAPGTYVLTAALDDGARLYTLAAGVLTLGDP